MTVPFAKAPPFGFTTAAALETRGTIRPEDKDTTSKTPSGASVPIPTCAILVKLAANNTALSNNFFIFIRIINTQNLFRNFTTKISKYLIIKSYNFQ